MFDSTVTKIKRKVVVNKAYGGFSLSHDAQKQLALRKGLSLRYEEKTDSYFVIEWKEHEWETIISHVTRDDPDLIEVVTQLGDRANGPTSKLVVKDIQIEIYIRDNDGYETVHVGGGEW